MSAWPIVFYAEDVSHTRVSWSLSSCVYGGIINAYHDQGKTVRDLSLIASCPLADVLNSHHRNSVCSQCAQCLADCRLTLQVSDLVGVFPPACCLCLVRALGRYYACWPCSVITCQGEASLGLSYLFYQVLWTIYLFKSNLLFSDPSDQNHLFTGNVTWKCTVTQCVVLRWRRSLREHFFFSVVVCFEIVFQVFEVPVQRCAFSFHCCQALTQAEWLVAKEWDYTQIYCTHLHVMLVLSSKVWVF